MRENLTEALREFCAVSGFRAALLSPELKEIAAYPEAEIPFCAYICLHSRAEADECRAYRKRLAEKAALSGKAEYVKCRHRLIEAMLPLYYYGALSGYLSLSGIMPDGENSARLSAALSHLGKKEADASAIADSVPRATDEKISSLIRIISMCAEHLALASQISEAKPAISILVRRYVDENYKKHIGIKDVCEAVGYSKSTVLNAFKADFGMTVGAYICSARLDAAVRMLRSSPLTVAEIATKSGFSDQSYFSKVFSARFGKTPTEYRKELNR